MDLRALASDLDSRVKQACPINRSAELWRKGIRTDRLFLRPLREGDGSKYKAVNSAILGPSENESDSYERKICEDFDERSDQTLATLAVDRDEEFIGYCGYFAERSLGWEILIFLHPSFWRKGFGDEIGHCLLKVGLDALGVERLYGLPMHLKAEELCRRIGMRRLGRRKVKCRPVYYVGSDPKKRRQTAAK